MTAIVETNITRTPSMTPGGKSVEPLNMQNKTNSIGLGEEKTWGKSRQKNSTFGSKTIMFSKTSI